MQVVRKMLWWEMDYEYMHTISQQLYIVDESVSGSPEMFSHLNQKTESIFFEREIHCLDSMLMYVVIILDT